MLIPAERGETISFQTTKRRLLVWLCLSFGCVGIVGFKATRGLLRTALSGAEDQSVSVAGASQGDLDQLTARYEARFSDLRAHYEELLAEAEEQRDAMERASETMAEEFARVVDRHRRQLEMFADLTSLPVDVTIAAGDTDQGTSESVGRGGPWPGLPEDVAMLSPVLEQAEQRLIEMMGVNESLSGLNDHLEGRQQLLVHTPILSPIQEHWVMTDGFGPRRHPISGERDFHNGLDMAAPYGTPIVAPADGDVEFVGRRVGYGRTVILTHGAGLNIADEGQDEEVRLSTLFGHLSRIAVSEGDHVTRGQVIGYVGSSGFATGAHLHYEVRVAGSPVDPLDFIMEP
ncbi:M23 family metallopeptidase [Candidatus Sumerlaeota bacterium]|nr:M23 family metallopeptidase [Candidatus Sumerlaeota bacterium]